MPPSNLFASADPYRQQAEKDAANASSITASAGDLPNLLKQALNEKLGNSSLVTERSNAASGFLTELGNAPTTVLPQNTGGVILNPTEQNALISGRRASALNPLIQANQRYDLNTGSIADIIGSAGSTANKMAQLSQSQAAQSRQSYQDIIDRLTQEETFNLQKQKMAQDLGIAKMKISASSSKIPAADKKLAAQIAAAQTGKSLVTEAMGTLSGLKTGPQAGLANLIQNLTGIQVPGLYNKDTSKAQTEISKVNTKLFEIAGKSLTKSETPRISGLVLSVKDSPQVLQDKLNGWLSLFDQAEATGYLTPSLYGSLDDGVQNEWEIVSQ